MSEFQPVRGLGDWVASHSQLGALFTDFQQSFAELPQLPTSVLPLCRIRMNQLHGHNPGRSDADKELFEAVSRWPDEDQFSSIEKTCLAFTEVYAMDVHAITDAHADAVKQVVGESGLVALVQALGVYYAETRLEKLWGLSERSTEAGQTL